MIARVAALGAALLLLTSCTRYADDARAVPGAELLAAVDSGESQCETVDAPLTTIPAQGTGEPVLKIPQPKGWERSTKMDSEIIRFFMGNRDLGTPDFAPTAVVTLESADGVADPEVVFSYQRSALESHMKVTGFRSEDRTVCGSPALFARYIMPQIGAVAPHPAEVLIVVLSTDDHTYVATVTTQTTAPNNPGYRRDSTAIISGFQMLQPQA